ncbi:MAG: toprim domain-containing protein [Rhizobiaceae bacterium]
MCRSTSATTWLDPAGNVKEPVADRRRSLGHLLGNAVWLGLDPGTPVPVMAAGEGFETMASLRTVMPALPVAAATSANHLAGLSFPPGRCRLFKAADADAAGWHGIQRLSQRASEAGILTMVLRPQLGDFNDDLRHLGPGHLVAWLRELVPDDARRLPPSG